PEQLRAVVVVDPQISDAELDRLEASGTVGVRLNLVGLALDDFAQPRWQEFFLQLARRHRSAENQRGMEDLALTLPSILESGAAVVLDQFGLPRGTIDPVPSSHGRFLSPLAHELLWIKLSATSRNNLALDQAAAN